ncbi:hypothetical protein CYMTET_38468 [Cymbomonas tetramitiformis]|uniref:Uncharacterized protein n=1 Tax=Cymbomonas tetramitiformis TaxID=36881 RepID=A0AAE0CE31_9CHLO|nr:hypothetical protein CYMTET_38468 [Cymbomonas tetramitiformis]
MGPPVHVAALAFETYMEEAVAIGLDIQPVKSAAFLLHGDASCFEVGMPVTSGTEDLGAENDLPYVNALQAAMHKVSEAVEPWSSVQRNTEWPCSTFFMQSNPYLLGQVEECSDCGGEQDPTETYLSACRARAGAGAGNWGHGEGSFIVIRPLASASHDDFAGHLTYSRNHCPDVTVLDAEGPGQYAMFDVATARPMSDVHLGAAMMPPGAAAKKVEESKVVNGNEDEDEDKEAAHGGLWAGKRNGSGSFLSRLHEGLQG